MLLLRRSDGPHPCQSRRFISAQIVAPVLVQLVAHVATQALKYATNCALQQLLDSHTGARFLDGWLDSGGHSRLLRLLGCHAGARLLNVTASARSSHRRSCVPANIYPSLFCLKDLY